MSDESSVEVSAQALEPLVEVANRSKQAAFKVAALGAIPRFALSPEAWTLYGKVIRNTIAGEPAGTGLRRDAIRIGVGVPLLSVREAVRSIAGSGMPDARFARKLLDEAGDASGIAPLLARIKAGRATPETYRLLARMPLESAGLAPEDLPRLSGRLRWNDELWRALALARLGDYSLVDAFLAETGHETAGSARRTAARHAVASLFPLPLGMQQHLLEKMPELVFDMGAALRFASTRGPVRVRSHHSSIAPYGLTFDSRGIAQRILDESVPAAEMEAVKLLPERYLSSIVGDMVDEGNRRATKVKMSRQAISVFGKRILDAMPGPRIVIGDLPVDKMLLAQVRTKRTVLTDQQLAYVISHDSADHLIGMTPHLMNDAGTSANRVMRIVGRAGEFQSGRQPHPVFGTSYTDAPETSFRVELMDDVTPSRYEAADSGAAPWVEDADIDSIPEVDTQLIPEPDTDILGLDPEPPSSADEADAAYDRAMLALEHAEAGDAGDALEATGEMHAMPALDEPHVGFSRAVPPDSPRVPPEPAASPPSIRSSGPPVDEPPDKGGAPPIEARRVHAQIFHGDEERKTFVAGGNHVVSVTIGVPGRVRGAPANQPIPQVEIPQSGVTLDVVLHWNDQSRQDTLTLPSDPRKSSTSCNLSLHVPADTPFVSADIAFLYRGRVFELVKVEASVIAAGVPEQEAHRIDVKVQLHRREVAELSDTRPFDAAIVVDRSLRIYDGAGARDYALQESKAATEWLNDALFVTQDSLVRRRAQVREGDPQLDINDEAVRRLFVRMAQHGTIMFNGLTQRGYVDRGARIQVVNYHPERYVPLEFIYDHGHPTDDATVCPDGLAAIAADQDRCPRCSAVVLSADDRTRMKTVCPTGFWAMQKVIERLDLTEDARRTSTGYAAPARDRRHLPSFSSALFASSHVVPDAERTLTKSEIERFIAKASCVEDWVEWKSALDSPVPLLIALPHHGVADQIDYLQIGADDQATELGRLYRSQLNTLYVNPGEARPGPVVFLLGCRTNAQTADGYGLLAGQFLSLSASIVVGTTAEILGIHAAPVAREFVRQLVTDDRAEDFGVVMRRARRRMLASGYLLAMGLVALGDAQWRLAPRVH